MTDITERLRQYGDGLPAGLMLMRNAADEIDRLRAALWQCFTDAGGDTDGKTDAAGISTDDLISTTTDCVKDLRLGYDEMLDESSEADRLRARVAELETVEAAARVAELERTGSAVVARWDSPNWKDGTHTKDYIDALRAALSKDATP